MKALLNSLTNTYKALKLLSNPHVNAYLEARLTDTHSSSREEAPVRLGKNNAYYHKHYIVHVVN